VLDKYNRDELVRAIEHAIELPCEDGSQCILDAVFKSPSECDLPETVAEIRQQYVVTMVKYGIWSLRRALFEEGASTECPNDHFDQMFDADGKPLPFARGLTDAAGGGIYSIFTPLIANGAGKLGDGEHFLTFLFLLLKFIGSSSWLKLASLARGPVGSSQQRDFVGAVLDRVGLAGCITASSLWPKGDTDGILLEFVACRCEDRTLRYGDGVQERRTLCVDR